jgi:hypothetical protein
MPKRNPTIQIMKTSSYLPAVRSRRAFLKTMESETHLQKLDESDRKNLLYMLYGVAQYKAYCDLLIAGDKADAPRFRAIGKTFLQTRRLIHDAIRSIKKARTTLHTAGRTLPMDGKRRYMLSSAKAMKELKRCSREMLGWWRFWAVRINPKLRTKREEQSTRGGEIIYNERLRRYIARTRAFRPFMSNKPGRTIDQWFIGQAADILDVHSELAGRKIERYDQIINKLFDAAFGERRQDTAVDSIRRSLRRQARNGRVQLEVDGPPFRVIILPPIKTIRP